MDFDACEHRIRQVVIHAGIQRRKDLGLPEENNITTLYNEMAPLLGIPIVQLNSRINGDHLPSPAEMKNASGEFIVPRKDCPKCHQKETMMLTPLCQSCEDAEGGKYKSAWICLSCQHKEKSEKFFTQLLNEMGVEIPQGMKQGMGIKTLTDEGLK